MEDRRIRRKCGFGILETVVVLAMMLIMLTALVPLLIQSVNALQLAADAQNIASELQLAKFRAASQSTPYQVTFSTTDANSTLQRYDATGTTFQNEGSPTALATSSAFVTTPCSVPSGAPASMSTTIRFNTHGVPTDNAGTPTGNNGVYLSNGGQTMYAITVALSGRIQVWWFDGNQWTAQ